MNFLDIIIIIVCVIYAIKGFRKGLVIELATLAALVLGVFAGIYLCDWLAHWLINSFGMNEHYVMAAAFVIILIVVIILVHLLARALTKVINLIALGFMNKLCGSVFSVAKAVFLLSCLMFAMAKFDYSQNLIKETTRSNSLLYEPISGIAPVVIPKIKEQVERLRNQQSGVLDE